MSKSAEESAIPHPGDANPDKPHEIWALCTTGPACPRFPLGRYVTTSRRKLAEAGYKQPCLTCAQRARWERPGHRHPKQRDSEVIYPSNSAALLSERSDEEIKNNLSPFRCGVCGGKHTEYWEGGDGNDRSASHFCPACKPWARLILRPRQHNVRGAGRDAVYAKIRRVREWLAMDVTKVPAGPKMPFWAFATVWAEQYQRNNKPVSWGNYLAYYRHTILFFEDKPIRGIGAEEVKALEAYLLREPGTRGARTKATVGHMLESLRRMLNYAVEHGWLKSNPFSEKALVPRYVPLKSDDIVTVDVEDKLLAACVGKSSFLKVPFIYLADTGAYDSYRQALSWQDVRFEEGRVSAAGG